jgi:hypothetical protein
MLDWFSGYVGYDASQLAVGRFFEVDGRGEIVRQVPRWETARGSFDSGVQITRGIATDAMLKVGRDRLGFLCSEDVLRVSGNPVKFLQGHNAAGPSVSQLGPVLQALVRAFGEGFRPPDADEPVLPSVHRSRVDITTAVDLGSHQAVHDWLTWAGKSTRSRHGRALDAKGTVYWGAGSRRWTLKAYCKHCELRVHRPGVPDALFAELLEWTRTHLRVELQLRRPELKDREGLEESLIWTYARKVEVGAMRVTQHAAETLSSRTKAALQLWYQGNALESFYPRATLYRYRREIIDATGVDILLPRVEQSDAAASTLLSLDELQAREVKVVPERIQRSLFGAAT